MKSHAIDRVSADDLMSLASERGTAPMQVGAVLMLDTGDRLDPQLIADAIAHRVFGVPRLRQRLVKVPWWCGRLAWVDDGAFTVSSHFSVLRCPAPGGEAAVLGVAAEMLVTQLPHDRPLWAATLVTETGPGEAALVVVFHHVLADGVGGLAVLGGLVDGATEAHGTASARPMPSPKELVLDAAMARVRSVGRLPAVLRRLRDAASELRPGFRVRAAPSSLNTPTGPRRRFATVRVDLNELRRAAHAHQATVNDVVLSAVAAALHRLLEVRGERVDQFVISVPFSARRQASAHDLGNQSGVIPLLVSGVGDPAWRLESVAETTRVAKRKQPGASTALLGPVFRALARAGLYRRFIDRQRFIHTFVTNLRGPESRLLFLDCPITGIIPLSVATGNVTVSFAVLSYAGSLTVTLIADPETCPDLSVLGEALSEEFRVLTNDHPQAQEHG